MTQHSTRPRPERRKRPGKPPVLIQLEVALAQYFRLAVIEARQSAKVESWMRPPSAALARTLASIAAEAGCGIGDLRLDHDPMLRVRAYRPRKGRPVASWYTPHAHDPLHLKWRPQGPQFEGSHHVKTYVRGERGQYSDTVLAKRQRRREKGKATKARDRRKISTPAKRKWPSRPFPKRPTNWAKKST